ncbi:54S ribosomal protein L4 mitochondrial [Entomophthora muscae]|uniref:54S ribosomal protein L4 mitochondrial n=1 Tax=Entomophthora muscae TaxID=34485 RepID=A0ACC2RL79_9FUNG|nr:54S ribosomal protein L4 mitochondrial [Entomophthora muscae]
MCALRFAKNIALSTVKSTNRLLSRGLEEFFENGVSLPLTRAHTGRAWRATELRLKSFEDLHKLWFVNLKERNVLATQRAEARRWRITEESFTNKGRNIKVKKNMARILTVLNERRIQWELAKKADMSSNTKNTILPSTAETKSEVNTA